MWVLCKIQAFFLPHLLKMALFRRIVVSDYSECKQDKLSLEQTTTFEIDGNDPVSSQ